LSARAGGSGSLAKAIGTAEITRPGSSRLDLGEGLLYPLPVLRSLLIGRCLRLGIGLRVECQ
jgi:hypothetical protein